MLFNSYIFIFAFLPLCLIGYHLLSGRNAFIAKALLIGFSLWFYAYFNLSYLYIMIGSVLCNYLIYKGIERYSSKRRFIFVGGIVLNIGVLFYFKYFDFFITNVNSLFGKNLPLLHVLLPLGISFFTFQQISFLHDAYKHELPDVSFVDYALFVTFFPQLIAGPIVMAKEMLPQFGVVGHKRLDIDKLASGIYTFVLGLAKKVLIADTFASVVDYGYLNLSLMSSTESVLLILFYTLQLYFDFSGYCDMAIGIGRMLGFEIALNFNSPYKSKNIIEFWKRWHITLSRFFTQNIYIPLGGNRKGAFRMYINLFIVFLLSGIWHGAGYNYILWGCMHGLLYVITKAVNKSRKTKDIVRIRNKKEQIANRVLDVIKVLLTFVFVNVAWVFFRAPDIENALLVFANVFACNWIAPSEQFIQSFNLGEFWYILKILRLASFDWSKYILMILETLVALMIVFFMPNVHELAARRAKKKNEHAVITGVMIGALLVWCIVSLSGVSTFLYFNF